VGAACTLHQMRSTTQSIHGRRVTCPLQQMQCDAGNNTCTPQSISSITAKQNTHNSNLSSAPFCSNYLNTSNCNPSGGAPARALVALNAVRLAAMRECNHNVPTTLKICRWCGPQGHQSLVMLDRSVLDHDVAVLRARTQSYRGPLGLGLAAAADHCTHLN
jgi:hypothetical protein